MQPNIHDYNRLILSPSLQKHSSWFVIIGLILMIIGLFAFSYQFIFTLFSVYVIGALLIVAGASQVIHSFKTKSVSQTALWAVMGVFYIIAGIISFTQPIEMSAVLTLLIAFLLLVSGISQIISALNNKKLPQWGWILFSGMLTLLLGILIIAGWPINSLWILGLFLGIDLLFQGWAYVAIGLSLKNSTKRYKHSNNTTNSNTDIDNQ